MPHHAHKRVRVASVGIAIGVLVPLMLALMKPARARAQGEDAAAEPVRVRFDGPAGCPDGARFLEEVRARTPRVRAARDAEPARVFRVTVRREGDNATGHLVVEDTDHASAPRKVTGATCEEVVSALSLVAALAVDPRATTGTPATIATPTATTTASDASETPPPEPPPPRPPSVSPTPVTPTPTAIAPARTRASGAEPRAPSSPMRPWKYTAGASFDVMGAAAPGAVPGGSVFLDVGPEGDVWLTPSVRAAAARFVGSTVSVAPGEARFAWTVGQLEGCPVRVRLASGVWTKPCVGMEAGAISAEGSGAGISDAQSRLRFWLSADARLRFESLLFARVVVQLYGGMKLPLTRESFLFRSDLTVYTPPAAMLVGGAGLGVRFP